MVTQILGHRTDSAAEDNEDSVVEVVAVGDAAAVGDPEHLLDAQGKEVAGEGTKAVVQHAEEKNQSRRFSKLLMAVVGERLPEGQAQSYSEEEEVRLPEQGEAGMQ